MLRITDEEYERWRRTLSEFSRSLTLPLKKNVLVEASAWKPSNTLHADESNCNKLSCENNRLRHANVAFDRYFTGQMPNIAECSLQSRPCLSQLNILWYSVSTTAFSLISLFFSCLDTTAERDSLIECVFPKLKNYCRENYGFEFQVCSTVTLSVSLFNPSFS